MFCLFTCPCFSLLFLPFQPTIFRNGWSHVFVGHLLTSLPGGFHRCCVFCTWPWPFELCSFNWNQGGLTTQDVSEKTHCYTEKTRRCLNLCSKINHEDHLRENHPTLKCNVMPTQNPTHFFRSSNGHIMSPKRLWANCAMYLWTPR